MNVLDWASGLHLTLKILGLQAFFSPWARYHEVIHELTFALEE